MTHLLSDVSPGHPLVRSLSDTFFSSWALTPSELTLVTYLFICVFASPIRAHASWERRPCLFSLHRVPRAWPRAWPPAGLCTYVLNEWHLQAGPRGLTQPSGRALATQEELLLSETDRRSGGQSQGATFISEMILLGIGLA